MSDMKWPEKKEHNKYCYDTNGIRDCECDQWNSCIDAHEPIRRELEGMNKEVLTVTCPSCQEKFKPYTIHKCKESHPPLAPFSEDEVMVINGIEYVMKSKAEHFIKFGLLEQVDHPPTPELPSLSVEDIYDILCEHNGVKYMESSEDKVDRVRAEVMKNNYQNTALAIHRAIKERK